MTLLYSSAAPAGWNALPLDIKEKFYNIASKGDWSATEAYDHLVPDILKDNPSEVEVWMDGGTVSVPVDTYEIGRASSGIDTVEYTIPDRDVSRIEAGVNGGEYSVDNTIMEDAGINRARGGVDMTETELDAVIEQNALDAQIIDNSIIDASVEVTETTSNLAGNFLLDALLPTLGAVKVGSWTASKFKSDKDKWGWGMLAAGATAAVLSSTVGPYIAAGYAAHSITRMGLKLAGHKPSW